MRALDQVLGNATRIRKYLTLNMYKDAENAACEIVKNIFEEAPILGLDIDGVLDEAPEFFSLLSKVWPGLVYIITYRNDANKAADDVRKLNIYYDGLVLAKGLDDKARIIRELAINVYIDDQDECLSNIDPEVTVMKFRNDGNFDSGKWLYSERTGTKV